MKLVTNKRIQKFMESRSMESKYWIRHKFGSKWYIMSFEYIVFETVSPDNTNVSCDISNMELK